MYSFQNVAQASVWLNGMPRDAHDYGNGVGIEEYSNHLYVFERTDVDGFLVQSDHRGLQSGICRPVHFEGGLPVEDPSREPGGHDELGHVRFACLHNPTENSLCIFMPQCLFSRAKCYTFAKANM